MSDVVLVKTLNGALAPADAEAAAFVEKLHEKGGGEIRIKRLAGLGKHVANGISNLIDCEHEKIVASIEAAEAQEGVRHEGA
ncbi:MAG: hypothetical protein LBO00_10315 [Zoogloeaceae bacterium]|jgi:hypothetical protein|nr:hypothetical protein [Zoogloeaceae bacterium]